MNLVITGAGGFLGRELLKQAKDLLRQGKEWNIIAVSGRLTDSDLMVLDREIFFTDYRFSDADVLINCAFPRNTDGIQMAEGLTYIARLFEKASSEGPGAVINISTQSVYSQLRTAPANERTQLSLESCYAVGKYAAELMVNSLCRGIPHTNIRMASLIGAGFSQRVVNRMVEKAMEGQALIVNRSRRRFGFLDVRDAAGAILRMAQETPRDWEEAYVLGPEKSYSLMDMAEAVREATGCIVKTVDTDEAGDTGLDSRLLYRRLAWNPEYSLRQSVEEIMENRKAEKVKSGFGGG